MSDQFFALNYGYSTWEHRITWLKNYSEKILSETESWHKLTYNLTQCYK